MIRILHVLGGLNLGGAESMVMNLYRAIDRTEIQFDFVIHKNEKQAYEDEILEMGGTIYRFPQFSLKNSCKLTYVWNKFFREHPEYKVMHSHVRSYASLYIPIAKKYGIKTIIHSHSTSNGQGFSAMVKSVLQYPLRYQADYLFACSENAGRWLYGKSVCKKSNYRIIPNAINTKQYAYSEIVRNEMRKQLGIENKFVIGHVGRMTDAKNHMFLLKIFSELLKIRNDSILLLIGDGELRYSVEKEIERLNIQENTMVLGNRMNTEAYYQAMDVFVFPSLWEGLGIVLIEAQTAGLKCVISEKIPKEINLNTGLIEVLKLQESEKKWARIISNLRLENRKGQREAACMAGYDIEKNAREIEKFYKNLIG